VSNPFSKKAGIKGRGKANPFSTKAGINANGNKPAEPPLTKRQRRAALRATEQRPQGIRNPNNPWVRRAHDIDVKLTEIDERLIIASATYNELLAAATKAKSNEDITHAFNKADRAMNTILNLSSQRRQLIGGSR
jgi:hypothetical protein